MNTLRFNGFDVISDDSYALMGFVTMHAKDINPERSGTPCLLLITHTTLLEIHDFLVRHINAFICHDLIILIGPISAKTLVNGVTKTTVSFIDIHNATGFISSELDRILNIPCHQGCLHEPLTRCEKRILALLLRGYSGPLIARLTDTTKKNISSHKRAAMRKYGVSSTILLAMKYSLDLNLSNALMTSFY